MKNIIEFYYNIRIDEIHNKNDYYFFDVNKSHYIFKPYFDDIDKTLDIYKLNRLLSERTNIDNIILNRYGNPITKVNNSFYVLILNKNKNRITLADISNMANISDINNQPLDKLERNNWEILWANKIDYFEMQVHENAKKYPLIRESFDYFIGLSENAISYLVNTKREVSPTIYDVKVISHNSLDNSLYDPSNIILDHKARDVAEYIKMSFFNNNLNIFKELEEYFHYNYYSIYGIRVLFARILYPSFYFDLYDGIISGKNDEKELNMIIDKINDYEVYLYNLYLFLRKFYDIPIVEWLKKTRY
ncbi:MAG: hypothetical protein ACI4VL_02485 [Bacilli bacterium]